MHTNTDALVQELQATLANPAILAIRYRQGYPDYLISADSDDGEPLRGWWNSGESPEDIRWYSEERTGWPEPVQP